MYLVIYIYYIHLICSFDLKQRRHLQLAGFPFRPSVIPSYLDQLFLFRESASGGAVVITYKLQAAKCFKMDVFKEPWLQKYEDLIHHPIETTIFDKNGCFKLQVKIIQKTSGKRLVDGWPVGGLLSGLGVTDMNVTITSGPCGLHLRDPTCLWFQELSKQRTLWMDPEKTWVIRNLLNGRGPLIGIWSHLIFDGMMQNPTLIWRIMGAEHTPTS